MAVSTGAVVVVAMPMAVIVIVIVIVVVVRVPVFHARTMEPGRRRRLLQPPRMLPRLLWAARNRRNRPAAPPPPLSALATAGHVALYASLLLMPLSGIAIMLGNGYGLTVFGLELVPGGSEIPWLAAFGGAVHSPLAWLLAAMLAGHVVMALWHHFVRRDGVLRRML